MSKPQLKIASPQSGFSLIELAILLVIAGSLAAASTMMGSAYLAGSEVRSTRENIRTIDRAINSYVRVNKRLPCPADESLSHTDADFGKEATGLGTCTAATTTSGEVKKGVLPFQTLGMSKSMAYDAWGNRIDYYVDRRMTVENAIDIYPDQNTTIGDITVQDLAGGVRTDKAVYAVMSTGAKAHGSVNRSGNMRTLSDPSADELENTDVDASGASTGPDKVLVQGMIGKGSDAKDFDDILSYKKRSNLVSSNVNAIQNCLFSVVNWSEGANNCTGSVAEIADGTSVIVSDTTMQEMGSVTVSCNAGVLSQSSPDCEYIPNNCSPATVNWTVDAACAGSVGSTVLHGATTGSITNTTGGRTGAATFTCNDGTFNVNAGAVCGNNCTAGTANWTGTANCTAAYGALNHQANSTISDATAPGLGNVTMTCTNGTASQSAATCTPAGCGATSLSWGAGCSASVTAQTDGYSAGVTNGAAGYTGTGTAVCTDGAWSVTSPVCNADCTAQAVNWTVSGQSCTSSVGALTHGALMSVTDTVPTSTGAVTVTCNNGTLNQSAASCTTTAACMVGSAESLRFRNSASAFLQRTPASAATSRRKMTFSTWFKRGQIGCYSGQSGLIFAQGNGAGSSTFNIGFNDGNNNGVACDQISVINAPGGLNLSVATNQTLRDASKWYHLVVAIDTTQASASERVRIFIDGVRATATANTTYNTNILPSQNIDLVLGTAGNVMRVGRPDYGSWGYFDGYMDRTHYVDGDALEPTAFGEFDTNNIWIPKAYAGTYGTNGFKLEFDNATSTATLGNDSSGNGRNFTTTGFSIAADATKDSVGDHPGMNYATWNPIDANLVTASNGNLMASTPAFSNQIRATIGMSTGKYYWEVTPTSANGSQVCPGIVSERSPNTVWLGANALGWCYNGNVGTIFHNNGDTAFSTTFTQNDVIGVAFDADTGRLWFAKNGTWGASGNPGAGTNPARTVPTGQTYFPALGDGSNAAATTSTANFGQQPWRFTPPSGFQALAASNLPTPSIMKPSEHFDAITYRGNGGGQQIGQIARDSSNYQIERSLRFNQSNSAYLSRVPAPTGDRTTWTWSGWVKRGTLGGAVLFSARTDVSNQMYVALYSPNTLVLNDRVGGVNNHIWLTRTLSDTSRWYHLVAVYDATNATPGDRLRLYVDGVRETNISSSSYPALGKLGSANRAGVEHTIGREASIGGSHFDGYMSDVHFVDGQALPASAFGAFDSKGHWQPIAYAGAYGTNGFRLEFKDNSPAADLGKDVSGNNNHWTPNNFSVANDFTNDSLIDVPTSWDDTGGGEFATLDPANFYNLTINGGNLAMAGVSAYPSNVTATVPITDGRIYFEATVRAWGGSPNNMDFGLTGLVSGSRFGVSSGTYPFSWANSISRNWDNTGPANRVMQNGAEVPTNTLPTPTTGTVLQLAYDVAAGKVWVGQNGTWNDGGNPATGTNPTATGVVAPQWPTFQAYGASNGGLVLNFGATAFAHSPPAGFTGLTDGGRGRGNYPTLNPLDQRFGGTVSGGNLDFYLPRDTQVQSSWDLPKTGKWYWETDFQTYGDYSRCGVSADVGAGVSGTVVSYYTSGGGHYISAYPSGWQGPVATSVSLGNGTCMVAYDADNGKLFTGYNGGWHANGNPVTGVNAINQQPGTTGWNMKGIRWVPSAANHAPIGDQQPSTGSMNFGQRPFAFAPPTGYRALNSQNAGTNTSFVNRPDLVWLKSRTAATAHALYDSVRGIFRDLASNSGASETTQGGGVVQFNDDGVLIGDLAKINSVTPYSHQNVGWMWNEDPTAGFDIVNWSGTGAVQTMSHSLGKVPAMMIVKNRGSATNNDWYVYHKDLHSPAHAARIQLNQTSAKFTGTSVWASTNPTTTQFTAGNDISESGSNYVAYLWSEIPGFSKFGSYVGNGSADGPFVYTGFKPRWILRKQASGGAPGNWAVYDTERDSNNPAERGLFPHLSDAEFTGVPQLDILSNGFKVRVVPGGELNFSGSVYIYAAFAEKPFVPAGPADSGSASCGCALPWGGSLASGASVTAYQNAAPACGGSCTSETRTCTNGVLSGSYTAQSCAVAACSNCSANTGNWTVGANSCSAGVGMLAHLGFQDVTDSSGTTGAARVTCNNGSYTYSATSCNAAADANAFCGLSVRNIDFRPSHYYGGSTGNVDLPCKGVLPSSGCPAGYKHLTYTTTTWGDDPQSDNVYTCINETTNATGALAGTFCGGVNANFGSHVSILINGSGASSNTNCGASSPASSCPAGFNHFSIGTISYHADSIADYLHGCISNGGGNMVSQPVGTWCGLALINNGSRSSLYWNSGGTVNCVGHNPSVSCPSGFTGLAIGARAWADDDIADYAYTCIKSSETVGLLCGHSTWNNTNGWADGIACQGIYPRNGCPAGYSSQLVISNGGIDYHYHCVNNGSGANGAGRICGASTYNIYNGWADGIACQGNYPRNSCPAGYAQTSVIYGGGVDTEYHCSSTASASGAGRLCGHSTWNMYNGWSDGIACAGTYPRNGCPSGYSSQTVLSNGGVDIHYYCTLQ